MIENDKTPANMNLQNLFQLLSLVVSFQITWSKPELGWKKKTKKECNNNLILENASVFKTIVYYILEYSFRYEAHNARRAKAMHVLQCYRREVIETCKQLQKYQKQKQEKH